ncbi:uncharacterized protein LOC144250718 [Urocitellus parryii]
MSVETWCTPTVKLRSPVASAAHYFATPHTPGNVIRYTRPRPCISGRTNEAGSPAPATLSTPSSLPQYVYTDAENAFKVRLSIRRALGDKAYVWDTNEEYLFRAMVAFSMRKVPNRETTEFYTLLCSWHYYFLISLVI